MISELWPLFGLRLTTPRLELRLPREADFAGLCAAAARGIHEDGFMPFTIPWSTLPEPARTRGALQHHWRSWATWQPEDWALHLLVVHDGSPVGSQEVAARNFAARREVSTGSWLERAHQDRGLGTEMRAAVLHLAFAALNARWAVSAAFTDNPRSLAVSRKLGYRDDGREIPDNPGSPPRMLQRLRLDRLDWQAHRRVPVEIHGFEACRTMFGLGDERPRGLA